MVATATIYMPFFFFFFFFFLFHKAGGKWPPRWRVVKTGIREQHKKKKKARNCYELNYSSSFFLFSRFNHISIEPNNDTTRTRMYLLLLSVMGLWRSITFLLQLLSLPPVLAAAATDVFHYEVQLVQPEEAGGVELHHLLLLLLPGIKSYPESSYYSKCEWLHPETVVTVFHPRSLSCDISWICS